MALQGSTDVLLGHKQPIASTNAATQITPRLLKRAIKIQQLPKRDQQAIIRTIDAFLAKAK